MTTSTLDPIPDVGTSVRLSQIFASLDEIPVPLDPDTVEIKIKDPQGNESTEAYVRDGTGLYHVDVVAYVSGQYHWRWETTGPDRAVEGSFIVRRSEYLNAQPPDIFLTWGEFDLITWGEFDQLTWGNF